MNNNPLKLQEFMDMITTNLERSFRGLLEYNNISNEELEEIEDWFAKFEIQI